MNKLLKFDSCKMPMNTAISTCRTTCAHCMHFAWMLLQVNTSLRELDLERRRRGRRRRREREGEGEGEGERKRERERERKREEGREGEEEAGRELPFRLFSRGR